jgi:hypothetical protein
VQAVGGSSIVVREYGGIVAGGSCRRLRRSLPLPPDAAADATDALVDASLCEYATLSPNGDTDMDGVLNAMDRCPTVALEAVHDEDGDSILDACDPCPMTVVAGDDLDCDLIGAACDPTPTIPSRTYKRSSGSATPRD